MMFNNTNIQLIKEKNNQEHRKLIEYAKLFMDMYLKQKEKKNIE